MAFKVKGKDATGTLVEVELEEAPEGFIHENDLDERFAKELARRTQGLERKALAKALEDEGFKETALTKWGINLAELAKGGEMNAERLAKAKQEWAKAELEPVLGREKTLASEVERLRDRMLEAAIVTAAQGRGVKPGYLKALAGGKPLIVAAVKERFAWDEEHGEFFERDGKDGFVFSRSGKAPYRTVDETFEVLAGDKEFADFFDTQKPRGPGAGRGAGEGRGGDVTISRSDAKNHAKFTAAEEQAKQQGGQVVIVD